ncbi:MAG: hypothetical protein L6R43_08620 [Planctomycetes bacterium]|nr:hypothetical protein [Planctomycetota bacterium]
MAGWRQVVTEDDVNAPNGVAPLDGTGRLPAANAPPGTLLAITVYTANGTHTTATGCNTMVVDILGAGGGGGGAASMPVPPGGAAGGGGGAAGAFVRKTITGPVVSYPVTVGAGGLGGGPGLVGGNGSLSRFGSGGGAVTAPGGGGGQGVPNQVADGAFPGANCAVGTGGDINGQGGPGHAGLVLGVATVGVGGAGASSLYGGGGDVVVNGPGMNAAGYGAGGSGGGAQLGTNSPGGNGSPGLVVVYEYS